MADPLPHPSKDTPQRPNPNNPPSSPWLPGQSPAPSKKELVNLKIRKGAKGEDGTKYPMPVIEGNNTGDQGIGPGKEFFDFWGKYYGNETIQANVNNPRMDIMLPFNLKEDDSKYGEPQGTPEEIEELKRRGWASRPNQDMKIAQLHSANHAGNEDYWGSVRNHPNYSKPITGDKLLENAKRLNLLIRGVK